MARNYPVTFDVSEGDVGTPIDRYLRRRLEADPPHVQKLLRQRRVLFTPAASGSDTAAARLFSAGEEIPAPGRIEVRAASKGRPPPAPNRRVRPRFVFGDDHLLVVDKPPDLAVHPGPRHGNGTLLNGLVHRFPDLLLLGRERHYGLVHRLDFGTSGLLVVARREQAYDRLSRQFHQREVEKRYVALVRRPADGIPLGPVESRIGTRPARTEVLAVEPAGPDAPVARVEVRPVTGRTHQIRIHLASLRAPVLGDRRHGTGRDSLTARLYLKRLALHAERLAFRHPASGRRLEFERPMPADLRHSWRRARMLFARSPTAG